MRIASGILVFSITLLSACSSPEKLLQQGNYDTIIDKSVKALIKKPESTEDAINLDKAYRLANERDLDRIKYLKTENNPDTWDEMLGLYSSLKNRQATVRKVLPLNMGNERINYPMVDYDAEIVAAKRKAAEYYYNHAKKLMENRDKESFRQAYHELVKARNYSGDSFNNLSQLIEETKYKGTSRVLIGIENRTIINLPQEFMDGLIAVNAREINSEWVEYYTRKLDNSIQYDYYIDIILQSIAVSPDLSKDKDFIEKKRVDDGFEYVLDSRGNVMKDTAGNDIKVKKYKEIQCTVIETTQQKDCSITGEIEFLAANPESLIKKQPIAAATHFEFVSARAIGDKAALSESVRKTTEVKPVPFPDDLQMILDCSEALKKSIHEAIVYNRGALR